MAKNNFEGGVSGATITTANAGGTGNNQFDYITKDTNATAAFFAGSAHGTLSLQLATAATPGVGCAAGWNVTVGSPSIIYVRFYIYVGVSSTYPIRIFSIVNVGGTLLCAAIELQVDGRLSIIDGTGVEILITNQKIPVGVWNRIELKVVPSATLGQMELRLYKTMDSSTADEVLATSANLNIPTPMGGYDFGHSRTVRGNMGPIYLDDIATSIVGWVGPVLFTYPGSVSLIATPRLTISVLDRGAILIASPSLTISGKIVMGTGAVLIVSPILVATIAQPLAGISISLTIHLNFIVKGGAPPVIPEVTPPHVPYPAQSQPFRIIAQEILSKTFVDWDLPVQNDFSYTTQLSGPTSMQGTFQPEITSVQQLGLDGYAYFFHVEISGEIRATGIFLPPSHQETTITFSCEGFSSLPHYVTWGGQISGIGIDPLYVVRQVWNDTQNNPRSNLGVIVSNTVSNQTLGTPARSEVIKNDDGTTVINDVEAAPYELLWWNAPNDGETIDNLATQTPFDYRERVKWNSTKTAVELYIDLGYPRIGIPRDKLLFNDENILEVVPIQESDDTYASEVLVIGAGEGSATIRGYAAEPFGDRIRKVQVVTDKTITTVERANAVATSELGMRKGSLFSIDELVIHARHQNATIGEYDIGDDIFVQVIIPWLAEPHNVWYRVISITYQPALEIIRLKVARSDSFTYPTTPIAPPKTVTDDVRAAQAILDRMKSGDDISEDWTWPDCPDYVNVWNDSLLSGFISGHAYHWPESIPEAVVWLQAYIIARI